MTETSAFPSAASGVVFSADATALAVSGAIAVAAGLESSAEVVGESADAAAFCCARFMRSTITVARTAAMAVIPSAPIANARSKRRGGGAVDTAFPGFESEMLESCELE